MAKGSSHGLRHLAAAAAVLMGIALVSLGSTLSAGAVQPAIVSHYTHATISSPVGITVGADGALWFTNDGVDSIGRITTAGTVSNFTDPTISDPRYIVAGPDSALWFTNPSGNSIGRISTTGTVTSYTDSSISFPEGIAAGPDGALWFTNEGGDTIGRITTAGAVTSFADASLNFPFGIAAGPDGAMWVTNANSGVIDRIAMTGAITHFTSAAIANAGGSGITAGPDGAMWFTMVGRPGVGRITTAGAITRYTDPSLRFPTGITTGPDGALWFADHFCSCIGRLEPVPIVLPGVGSVVEGNTGTVALHVSVSLSAPSASTVTVQWTTKFTPGAPPGQADPANDFIPASGTVTFAPGDTSKSVTISVNGDTVVEPDELVVVSFSHPTHAKMGGYYGLGFGKIVNDD